MAFEDLDVDARKIEYLSELDAKVLLVRICTEMHRASKADDWSDGMENIYRLINAMLPGGAS